MQKKAWQTVLCAKEMIDLPFPISRITQDLVGFVGEMSPNLMAASGVQARF